MNRCLIFIASVFLAFVAISTAATASPSDWTQRAAVVGTSDHGAGPLASWATVPAPRLFAFVPVWL